MYIQGIKINVDLNLGNVVRRIRRGLGPLAPQLLKAYCGTKLLDSNLADYNLADISPLNEFNNKFNWIYYGFVLFHDFLVQGIFVYIINNNKP